MNHSSDTPEVLPLALNSSRRVDEVHHLAHANAIVDLYERHATSWAKDRGTKLLEKPWLDRFRASPSTLSSITNTRSAAVRTRRVRLFFNASAPTPPELAQEHTARGIVKHRKHSHR